MRSHISVHRATTKYFSNSFVLKNKIEKEGLPRDSLAGLGAGGPEFKSRRPDQNIACFLSLIESTLLSKFTCGIPPDRRSEFTSHLVSMSSSHGEFAKTWGGRSAIQKLLNRGKLSTRRLASMGKIMGTLCISRLINLRKYKSVRPAPRNLVHRKCSFSGVKQPERSSTMRKSRFSEEQIVRVLKEAESGVPVAELTRREGVSDVTFYRWKARCGGMEVGDARRLREWEDENSRLKKIVAQHALDIGSLKAVLSKKW
jgi:putative transposase